MRGLSLLLVFATLAFTTASALAQGGNQDSFACGPLASAFGPFDYRTATRDQINIVEQFHFNSRVESLQGGMTGTIGGDISYTLRAIPNHPRALLALSQLALRTKSATIAGMPYPVECWFDRAIRFQPDDPYPMVLLGSYLAKLSRGKEAAEWLNRGAALAPEGDANLHDNLGLAYLDAGQVERAVQHARIAYRRGFPLDGLRSRLAGAGVRLNSN
jgi:tetratricopeptide (TPR) repeat protein